MPNYEDIVNELSEILEGNGTIPQDKREKLTMTILGEIYRSIKDKEYGIETRLCRMEMFVPWLNAAKEKGGSDDRLQKIEKYIPWMDAAKIITILMLGAAVTLFVGILTHTFSFP